MLYSAIYLLSKQASVSKVCVSPICCCCYLPLRKRPIEKQMSGRLHTQSTNGQIFLSRLVSFSNNQWRVSITCSSQSKDSGDLWGRDNRERAVCVEQSEGDRENTEESDRGPKITAKWQNNFINSVFIEWQVPLNFLEGLCIAQWHAWGKWGKKRMGPLCIERALFYCSSHIWLKNCISMSGKGIEK